jgi:broad specificity phosphatase PhoE
MIVLDQTPDLRLYLIRHGEVEDWARGKLLGKLDAPLSSDGRERSAQLAGALSSINLSAIYTSDLQRARMTAEIIAAPHGLKVEAETAWQEIDMGEWDGRTMESIYAECTGVNVALVTHAGVCRTIIGTALGMPLRYWLRLGQDYGCVNVIDWYDRVPTVRRVNLIPTTDIGSLIIRADELLH